MNCYLYITIINDVSDCLYNGVNYNNFVTAQMVVLDILDNNTDAVKFSSYIWKAHPTLIFLLINDMA